MRSEIHIGWALIAGRVTGHSEVMLPPLRRGLISGWIFVI